MPLKLHIAMIMTILNLLFAGCGISDPFVKKKAQPLVPASKSQSSEKSNRRSDLGIVQVSDAASSGELQQVNWNQALQSFTPESVDPGDVVNGTTLLSDPMVDPMVAGNEPGTIDPETSDHVVAGRFPGRTREMSLGEAIRIALSDTTILRSLNAAIVRNPAGAISSLDPEIRNSDANFGEQAALAAFDAVFTTSANYANNDDFFNNPATTGNAAVIQQDLATVRSGLNKVNQYGTRLSAGQVLAHDNNNNPSVFFPNSWEQSFELTARQPLLQGRGREFNTIAGPNSRPGFFNTAGVRIARTNYQIAQSDFERELNDFILEVINAYWRLELAYRNYETILSARDTSYETWLLVKSRFDNSLKGGEADREAQARVQLFTLERQLNEAINGLGDSGAPGILQAEADLRRLLNLSVVSEELIRPADTPSEAPWVFDWQDLANRALTSRIELSQQEIRIQQANLTILAAKNFLLPRLDAFTTFRTSGLGDDLVGSGGQFAGALNEIFDGNFHEWEFGVEYAVPIGRRQAHAGVRNAILQLNREEAVYAEMQQQILYTLRVQLRALEQSKINIFYANLQRKAAVDAYQARRAAYTADAIGFEDLLIAEQDLVRAELGLQIAKTEQQQSLYRLIRERGTLLQEFTLSADSEPIAEAIHASPSEKRNSMIP